MPRWIDIGGFPENLDSKEQGTTAGRIVAPETGH
jgi:hypothetical protein